MPFAVPIALPQWWLFAILSLVFFALVVLAMLRRPKDSGSRSDARARLGIILQSMGIALAAFGPARPSLDWFSLAAIAGYAAVTLLMGAAIVLFGWSSTTLGKNWSFAARTLDDHELIRTGPYARVRHPIYLAMLLFQLGLAAALGHWLQLIVAVPVFLVGTRIRTKAEERLLEQSFGEAFRDYRSSTPALFPKIV
jgi:protein-S-isoprenylcysteine O-methyltransferase Ste14